MKMVIIGRSYVAAEAAVFRKASGPFGACQNMASGYPIKIGDLLFHTSEALYQACRFPHLPDLQAEIAAERNGFKAKLISKAHKNETRPDWDDGLAKVAAMHWVIRAKLVCNLERFGEVLLSTGDMPIVEYSAKDPFWGAVPQMGGTLLHGCNVLGLLLTELREGMIANPDSVLEVQPPNIPEFLLMGHPVPVLKAV